MVTDHYNGSIFNNRLTLTYPQNIYLIGITQFYKNNKKKKN